MTPNPRPYALAPPTTDMPEFLTEPCPDLQQMKGLSFPADVKFRHVLITGPPGAGERTLIRKLGGWSEEGYPDLTQPRWWTDQALTFRPRKIHPGFPFIGFEQAHAVFEQCAVHLSLQGLRVNTREGAGRNPVCIVDNGCQDE